MLKALSLKESIERCKEIHATRKEISSALRLVRFICVGCGYHSGIIRRCPACGGRLRYWQLYERIIHLRSSDV